MMTNGRKWQGTKASRASSETEWKAYDALSPTVRRALQEASVKWSAAGVARFMRRTGKQPYEMPRIIASWDRETIRALAQKEADRRRGRRGKTAGPV